MSPGSGGRLQPDGGAGQLLGPHRRDHPGRPQRRAAVDAEAAERARGGQRLGLRHGEPDPAGQVGEVAVGAAAVALGVDQLGQLVPDAADLGQPEPDGLPAGG